MNPMSSLLHRGVRSAITGPVAMKRWRWLLAWLVVLVGWLALSPAPPETLSSGWDKLNHAGAFAALTVVGVFASPRSRNHRLALLGAVFCFGGLIEIAQSFTPTRSAEWADLLADAIGMAAGVMLTVLIARIARVDSRSD